MLCAEFVLYACRDLSECLGSLKVGQELRILVFEYDVCGIAVLAELGLLQDDRNIIVALLELGRDIGPSEIDIRGLAAERRSPDTGSGPAVHDKSALVCLNGKL